MMNWIRNAHLPVILPESSTDSPTSTIGPSVSLVGPPDASQYKNIPTTDQEIRRNMAQVGQLLRNIESQAKELQVTLPLMLRWRMKDMKAQLDHVVRVYGDHLKFFPNESPSQIVKQELATLDVMKQTVDKLFYELTLTEGWQRKAFKCRPQEPEYSTDESAIASPPGTRNFIPSPPGVPRNVFQQGPIKIENDSSDTDTLVEAPAAPPPVRHFESRQQPPPSQSAGPSRFGRRLISFLRPEPYPTPAATAAARTAASNSTQVPSTQQPLRNPTNIRGRISGNLTQQQQQHVSSNPVYALDTQGRPIPDQSAATAATLRHFIQVPRVIPAAPLPPPRPPTMFQQASGFGRNLQMGASQPRFWNPADYARLPTEYPLLSSTYNPRPFHHARR